MKILNFRLTITCENQVHGCTGIFKLETLSSHLTKCEHNPKKLVPCEQGCGLVVPKDEVKVCRNVIQKSITYSVGLQIHENNEDFSI